MGLLPAGAPGNGGSGGNVPKSGSGGNPPCDEAGNGGTGGVDAVVGVMDAATGG